MAALVAVLKYAGGRNNVDAASRLVSSVKHVHLARRVVNTNVFDPRNFPRNFSGYGHRGPCWACCGNWELVSHFCERSHTCQLVYRWRPRYHGHRSLQRASWRNCVCIAIAVILWKVAPVESARQPWRTRWGSLGALTYDDVDPQEQFDTGALEPDNSMITRSTDGQHVLLSGRSSSSITQLEKKKWCPCQPTLGVETAGADMEGRGEDSSWGGIYCRSSVSAHKSFVLKAVHVKWQGSCDVPQRADSLLLDLAYRGVRPWNCVRGSSSWVLCSCNTKTASSAWFCRRGSCHRDAEPSVEGRWALNCDEANIRSWCSPVNIEGGCWRGCQSGTQAAFSTLWHKARIALTTWSMSPNVRNECVSLACFRWRSRIGMALIRRCHIPSRNVTSTALDCPRVLGPCSHTPL